MNIQKMMKQAQEMQNKISSMQAKLEEEESEGSSGGGMVRVVMNGKGAVKKLTLDKSIIDPNDKEMLEDLIVAAFNDAKNKVETNMSDQMSKITSGLSLPPGMKLPF
ncbi:MAG TPA: YbaB/EbfC family nucleoid-associated protein [Rickettsiales bacterium]|nr:YbaB/EbfC family nucleoid-associated protein [Rickettsiales bacterium]